MKGRRVAHCTASYVFGSVSPEDILMVPIAVCIDGKEAAKMEFQLVRAMGESVRPEKIRNRAPGGSPASFNDKSGQPHNIYALVSEKCTLPPHPKTNYGSSDPFHARDCIIPSLSFLPRLTFSPNAIECVQMLGMETKKKYLFCPKCGRMTNATVSLYDHNKKYCPSRNA